MSGARWLAGLCQKDTGCGAKASRPACQDHCGDHCRNACCDGYVRAMLGLEGVFTHAIASHDTVITEVTSWYHRIDADGIAACLEEAALAGDSNKRSVRQ